MIKDTATTNNFTYTILRYFNPYGFTIDVDIVPFIKKTLIYFLKFNIIYGLIIKFHLKYMVIHIIQEMERV